MRYHKKSHENLGKKRIISTLRVGSYTPKIIKNKKSIGDFTKKHLKYNIII